MRALFAAALAGLLCESARAQFFEDATPLKAGFGAVAVNSLGKTTKKEDGSASSIGSLTYPLLVRYDFSLDSSWFFASQIGYTPIGRKSAGDSATTTLLHFLLCFGSKFFEFEEASLSWQVGVGFNRWTVAGAGGTETLSNGTGTATFARPGGTSVATLGVLDVGFFGAIGASRIGFDVWMEGAFSSKRSASLMVSWMYGIY